MSIENVAKVNAAIEEFRSSGKFLLDILGEQSFCNHLIMILKGYYDPADRDALAAVVLLMVSKMADSVLVVPFRNNNSTKDDRK